MAKKLPVEQLVFLYNQLEAYAPKSTMRKKIMSDFASNFNISPSNVYRQLRKSIEPLRHKRNDFNKPRLISTEELLEYCRLIAALKIRTSNKKDRHLSTPRCIYILENHGVDTGNGLIKAPKGLLKKSTVNRYMQQWGLDHHTMKTIEPVVVHFEAEQSNDCWQFDFSPSDLKYLNKNKDMKLFLISVTDDKSGVLYSEYVETQGEDVLVALKFLFKAMSPKKESGMPFQGIPKMLYTDNGSFAKSIIFKRVLAGLGIEFKTHLPRGKDGRRTTSRAKGKIERTNRTIKESFETLFHLHKPSKLSQANQWLMNYLKQYNGAPHRSEKLSKMVVWRQFLPTEGYRQMCSWEKFCQFVREPETRIVASDACVNVNGTSYQLTADMAGNEVILLHGILDNELYVEFLEKKFGPFYPSCGPIPLHSFHRHKKSITEKRADEIAQLAYTLSVPISIMAAEEPRIINSLEKSHAILNNQPYIPFDEDKIIFFQDQIEARQAIALFLNKPLAELSEQQSKHINQIIEESLNKHHVITKVKQLFTPTLVQVKEEEQ